MTIVGLYFHRLARRMTHRCTLAAAQFPPLRAKTPAPLLHLNLRFSTTSTFSNMNATNPATLDLDTIFELKKSLRFKIKKELKSMDPIYRSQEDDEIQRIVLESPWFKTCKRLCAYITCAALREVDTSKLLSEILRSTGKDGQYQVRKTLYVPRVEDKNSHMRMLNISTMDDLIANSMNILEPAPLDAQGNELEDVMLANEPVDLFLLPGLAFDKSGRRLGRGGGYYDTFLTKYQALAEERRWQKPLFIALSYSPQIFEEGVIPITPNDVFVDALVSSSGVIPITPAASALCS
ncbi:5-formyltetrahydrofolate cyclo-ligase, mitochondrial-like [Primulina huaijiensis]|uniref:5-formyltetrahydrofolate cyclo-ligase, mitochondrial-like n=1 Tax=Primulina huaijiensis TaxID=1492673 RepID=UPI003CC6FAE6